MIANLAGSRGAAWLPWAGPLPGVEATILARGPDGRAVVADNGTGPEVAEPGVDEASWRCDPAGPRCSVVLRAKRLRSPATLVSAESSATHLRSQLLHNPTTKEQQLSAAAETEQVEARSS